MEYVTSSSGITHVFNQVPQQRQQIIVTTYGRPMSSQTHYALPSLNASTSYNNNSKALVYGKSFLLSDEAKNIGMRSSSAVDLLRLRNDNISFRARRNVSMHYDSINDPHLKDFFEKKFQLSGAKRKRFKERKPGPNECVYKVKVKTGNFINASTDANVYLTISGNRGDLQHKHLFNKYNAIKTDSGYKFKFERNSLNVFKIIGLDVGRLSHIVIEHDGNDLHSSWFLQNILITNTKTHHSWVFECNDWLSKDHGLQKTRIQLFPRREIKKYAQTDYKIVTVTGDRQGASTDANVFITLYGTKNKQTPKLRLSNPNKSKDLFERGMTDVFQVNTNYVGPIQKVRIEHDNTGKSPGWFLERIVITDLKDPKVNYYCPCSKWLDKNQDDGLISRYLVASDDLLALRKVGNYKITVFTGNKRNAGTDADVKVTLYGSLGDSGEWKLDNSKNNFERGKIDEFMIECPSVGEIHKLKIGHNDKGPGSGWYLSKVIVDDTIMNRVYEFVAERWLARDEDDHQTTITLKPSSGFMSGKADSDVPYLVTVFTGDKRNAGTDARVFIELFGGKSGNESSGLIYLTEGKFERGDIDNLNINVPKMLSPLSKILIGHDNSNSSPGWYLSKVEVECPMIGMKQVFPCDRWLAVDEEDGKTEVILKENTSLRELRKSEEIWYLWIYTSDLKNAGTDANVSICIYGDQGKSDEIQLANKKQNTFETGKCDEFKIKTANVGRPFKIRVQHDNKGMAPGWHLNRIEMENITSKERYVFICNRWLSEDEDDGQIVRELPADGDNIRKPLPVVNYIVECHTGDKRGSGTDASVFINLFSKELGDTGERPLKKSETNSNPFERGKVDVFKLEAVTLKHLKKIRIGHNGRKPGAGWFLKKVVVRQEGNSKYDQTFECNRWLAADEDDGMIVRELLVDGAQFLDTTTYHVKVKTGDKRNAGTDARVSLKIFGDKGQSDVRHLKDSDNTSNKFERNKLDEFRIEADDLGHIEKIRIGHNGKGIGSGWFLDYIDIEVPSKGLVYKFGAHRWLDEDEGDRKTEIELYPTEVIKMKKTIPYVVTTKTGNKTGAGTNANVFIQFYGVDGKTEEYTLKNNTDNFEKGKEDKFKIEAEDVGPIYKVRIGHDDKGSNAAWYLENMTIQRHALKGSKRLKQHASNELETYYFFVNRWFSRSDDDKQIVRELIATDENGRPIIEIEEVVYEVKVFTGDKFGAGTDANVFLNIYGTQSDSGERELERSKKFNMFERNQCDTFKIKAVDLGELVKIKIRHDDSGGGAAWYLEKVEICNTSTNKIYLFNCQNWLANDQGDGKISRELPAIDPEQIKRVKFRQGAKNLKDQFLLETEALTVTYNVNVETSDIRGAGTDADVFIQLFGEKNDSGKITLETSKTNKNKFERGKIDLFEIKEADVGDIRKIRIGHNGRNPGAGWHLKEVVIDAPKLGKKWRFPCGRWLDKNEDDGKIERDLFPMDVSFEEYNPYVPYEIVVYTSDKKNADTSANPYICIYGEEIKTQQVELCKNKAERKDKFKRGAVDRFVLELDDVGKKIRKIRIGHDDKGLGSGWHLDKVEIRRLKDDGRGSKIYTFPCNRWLARDEDDRAIERDLVPTKMIDEKLENGETSSRERNIRDQLEMKNYTVEVFTGDVSRAGTDANVYLTIFGEFGDSGEKMLSKSETHTDKFERKNMDRFKIQAADLGKLFKVKVRHDNSGIMNKDWFLDRIEISVDREKYIFLCERWLSKSKEDKQIERTLFEKNYKGPRSVSASSMTLKSNIGGSQFGGSRDKLLIKQSSFGSGEQLYDGNIIPYKIIIRTGDEKNCGISSQVFIRLFGRSKKQRTDKIMLQLAKKKRFEPGSAEQFQIEALDVGELTQVELGHDGVGPKENWFVKDIEIHEPINGRSYFITCQQWLGTERGDGLCVRRFNVDEGTTKISSYRGLIPYNLLIFTGDVSKAGTDSNVTLKFFGTKGNSSDVFIEKIDNRFERASEDNLIIEIDDIGSLKKVRVSHDAKGNRKEWYLDRIEMTNIKTRKNYLFIANQWLAKSKNNCSIDVPLQKDGQETISATDYKITVKTSDKSGAGTNANVFVTLFGENGDSGELELKKSETNFDMFERNQIDVFSFKNLLSLGELGKLRIRHDNTGSLVGNTHWHLEYVKVEDLQKNRVYTFNCNKWLSLSKDDKQIVRELTPNEDNESGRHTPRPGDHTTYEITVITSDEQNAGTKQNAFIVLVGEQNRETKPKLLENTLDKKILRRGQLDKFIFKTKSVGSLKKVILGHIERNDEPSTRNAAWSCFEIKVKDVETGTTYLFPINDVLLLNKEPKAYKCKSTKESMVNITKQLKNVNYEVIVSTGHTGTSANVFITLFGEYGDTGKRPLKKTFDKDHTDKFMIESLDLGEIRKVLIEHDNTSFRKNWFLKQIEVVDTSGGRKYVFPCNKWLSKDKEDNETVRELFPIDNEESSHTRSPKSSSRRSLSNYDDYMNDSRNNSYRSDSSLRRNVKYDDSFDKYDTNSMKGFNLKDRPNSRSDRDLYYR